MSFEGELAPSFDLRCLRSVHVPDGWGVAFYPGGEPSAEVLKEAGWRKSDIRSELVKAWDHLASSLFVVHVRKARWGANTNANTQPFVRSLGGRDWLFAHSGSLTKRMEPTGLRPFEPVGSTDSELIFCELMSRMLESGWRSLGEADADVLAGWLGELNDHGELSIVLTDGNDLLVYADRNGAGPLHVWELLPPYGELTFGDDDLEVDLSRRGIQSRKGVIISSDPVAPERHQKIGGSLLEPGHIIIARQGAIRLRVAPKGAGADSPTPLVQRGIPVMRPKEAPEKLLEVRHRTVYRYANPVERSTHVLRLTPFHDPKQELVEHSVNVSVDGQQRLYEDVFGNAVRRVLLETEYTELVVDAHSKVRLKNTDPLKYNPLHARTTIPLVWMPWQRLMLTPFLLPPELPASQLRELVEYAMSFVKRNDSDLLDTLLDINLSIFREYEYRQGATNVFTTPFEVYTNRYGVCQDFTNLFICLVRLLGVPARYVSGYIYTGPKNPNQVQSEASHAWIEVFLPETGWTGLDPTNGILTQTDHVRVAVGRNWVDATPTAGTIYVGGGPETLIVDVKVDQLEPAEVPYAAQRPPEIAAPAQQQSQGDASPDAPVNDEPMQQLLPDPQAQALPQPQHDTQQQFAAQQNQPPPAGTAPQNTAPQNTAPQHTAPQNTAPQGNRSQQQGSPPQQQGNPPQNDLRPGDAPPEPGDDGSGSFG